MAYWFSVCSVVETFLGRFSWNFTSFTYHSMSHINPEIFGQCQDISAWNFWVCSEIIYVCRGGSNSTTKTWYLSRIVTRDSHQKMSQFPTLVAAHQAEVRGPPVGRGPQVENRWCRRRTNPHAMTLSLANKQYRWRCRVQDIADFGHPHSNTNRPRDKHQICRQKKQKNKQTGKEDTQASKLRDGHTCTCRDIGLLADRRQTYILNAQFVRNQGHTNRRLGIHIHIQIFHIFTFLLNQKKKHSSKTKHKIAEQRNNVEHKENYIERQKQEKPNTFL